MSRCFALTVLFALSSASAAHAFVRTPTCYLNQPSNPFRCLEGEVPRPIFWPQACVPWELHDQGIATIPDVAELERMVVDSFEPWRSADCASIDPVYAGRNPVAAVGPGSDPNNFNGNLILFAQEGWPNAPRVQALTSVTYRVSTGEIVDADIHVNAQFFTVNEVDPASPDLAIMDLQNTMTHEVGHFLGLDHTEEATFTGDSGQWREATMFASAELGEVRKRSLEVDDINGICAIYPRRSDDESCRCVISGAEVTLPDRDCEPLSENGVVNPDPEPAPDAGADASPDARSDAGLVIERHPGGCSLASTGHPVNASSLTALALALALATRRSRRS